MIEKKGECRWVLTRVERDEMDELGYDNLYCSSLSPLDLRKLESKDGYTLDFELCACVCAAFCKPILRMRGA